MIGCAKDDLPLAEKEPIIEEETETPVDSWICGIESINDDERRKQLAITNEGDYLLVGNDRIIQVSKDGLLKLDLEGQFTEERREEDKVLKKIYNNKIYSFSSSRPGDNFNPNQLVKLRIYNDTGGLEETIELGTFGVLQDVEIEDENTYGLLMGGEPNSKLMILSKFNKTDGILNSIILNDTGSNPRNLHIGVDGQYLCTDNSSFNNLYYMDNDLNLLWKKNISDITIRDAVFIPGKGICITGSTNPIFVTNYIAMVSEEGEIINKMEFPVSDSISDLLFVHDVALSDNTIALSEVEPTHGTRLRLTFFNFDLERITSLDVTGNKFSSPLINNDNGSFSFLYNIKTDPNEADPVTTTHPRVFKLNDTYAIPETYIMQ